MAQKKISDLPLASTAGDSDLVPIVQGGASKAAPVSVLRATPPGQIVTFAGAVPDGYIECDGRALSRVTYAALFAAIGTTYGDGNGATSFNVPTLARRHLIGAGGASTMTVMVPQPDGSEAPVTIAVAIIVPAIKA